MRVLIVALAAAIGIVACAPPAPQKAAPSTDPITAPAPQTDPGRAENAIPGPVGAKHQAMLQALQSAGLPGLAAIIAADGAKFSFGDAKDPLALWKTMDGDGRDVRAELIKALSLAGAPYQEGGVTVYAYPYLAALTPEQFNNAAIADYKTLAPPGWDPAKDPTFKEIGYLGWRAIIGADGKLEALVIGD